MKKKQLRKSDIRKLSDEISEKFGISGLFSKDDNIELASDEYDIIMINNEPSFFYLDGELLPTLKFCQKNDVLKKVVVDMGAVRFVTGGADIMRPGVVMADENIAEKEAVVVVDENNKVPLAICAAMFSGSEIMEKDSGKVLKNIHYVGDKLWELS